MTFSGGHSGASLPTRDRLRETGRVLLVACYELGHQPLSLASPLGFLEQAGFRPAALDLAVEGLDPERVRQARFVGISVPMHTALRLGVEAAARIRELNPDCHLCFYGLYASLNAGYLFARGADSVIGGEYEEPLVRWINALDAGTAPQIPGVHRPASEAASSAEPVAPYLQRFPMAPASRTALPPLSRYARLEHRGQWKLAGYTETSRGCKHLCRHCPLPPVYEGRFFVIPVERVLRDVEQQVRAGAEHLTFGDPDFLNGPGHALRVVRAVHQRFPHLTWDATVKIEHLLRHRDLLPEFAARGGLFLISAVESLSEPVLRHLLKEHTRTDVDTALDAVRSAGMFLRPSLIPFTPWETLDGYLELLDWVADRQLVDCIDPVHYSIRLLIPPGSHVLRIPDIAAHLGPLDESACSYLWSHPDPRMDALQREIATQVEAATRTGEPPSDTFNRVREAAYRSAGRPRPEPVAGPRDAPGPAPRLTESWFC